MSLGRGWPFTLVLVAVLCLRGALGERHPGVAAELGAQGGGHEDPLRRGHRGDGHLRHVGGGNVQRLGLAGGTDPPHLGGGGEQDVIRQPIDMVSGDTWYWSRIVCLFPQLN